VPSHPPLGTCGGGDTTSHLPTRGGGCSCLNDDKQQSLSWLGDVVSESQGGS
jgi:hypothetical protein